MEEVIIGRIPLELSLAHSAGSRWSEATFSVEALDEANFVQEPTAGWSLLVPDGFQQEALNRTLVRTAGRIGAGVDMSNCYCPHLTGIGGTLPRCIAI